MENSYEQKMNININFLFSNNKKNKDFKTQYATDLHEGGGK